ncbi:MAG: tetratricopeptide repeat protein [Chitinophagaceae bacterium]
MADQQTTPVQETIIEPKSTDVLASVGSFWEKNKKTISGLLIGAVVVVGGYYAYNSFVVAPKQQQANEVIFKAEQLFAVDSFKTAVEGGNGIKGFKYIASEFSGTPTGNRAKYLAGVSYYRLGEYNKAIEYLSDFKTDAAQIQMMAYGVLGDCYSELKKNTEAITAYKNAARIFTKDEVNASEYLFRAALLSEVTGNTKEALVLYKELEERFPRTDKGFQAKKYIYRLSIEPNDFSTK